MPETPIRGAELARQRCFNHAFRAAAARCRRCGRCFCRECVTEHAGRVICAQCLGRLARRGKATSRLMRGAAACVAAGAGLVAAWAVFYYLGQLLLRLPTPFHEGTLWGN